jgi:ankyrin repeat protein
MRAALGVVLLLAMLTSCELGPRARTPLDRAIEAEDLARVNRLLTHGANPNTRSILTPLMQAAEHDSAPIAEALIAHGAVVDKSIYGDQWTALFFAAESGSATVVRTLLAHGANPCIRTKRGSRRGMRASQIATREGHPDVEALLRQAEATRC